MDEALHEFPKGGAGKGVASLKNDTVAVIAPRSKDGHLDEP